MSKLIMLRGLPGSGKSTIAKSMCAEEFIHSTDRYFYVDGIYKFDQTKLGEYHDKNLAYVKLAMAASNSLVVVDNTNIIRAHMQLYLDAAKEFGYSTTELIIGRPKDSNHQVECAMRNVHKVPLATIQRMGNKFEY